MYPYPIDMTEMMMDDEPMRMPMYEEPYIDEFTEVLEMIKEAIQGEKEDEMFYNYLLGIAPTEDQKEIIQSISDDEMKHNAYFKQIYQDLTGETVMPADDIVFEKPKDYLDGIVKALFGEFRAVEKYRKIRELMPNTYYRDILFEIITDEIKHSGKYNYLFALNK